MVDAAPRRHGGVDKARHGLDPVIVERARGAQPIEGGAQHGGEPVEVLLLGYQAQNEVIWEVGGELLVGVHRSVHARALVSFGGGRGCARCGGAVHDDGRCGHGNVFYLC